MLEFSFPQDAIVPSTATVVFARHSGILGKCVKSVIVECVCIDERNGHEVNGTRQIRPASYAPLWCSS